MNKKESYEILTDVGNVERKTLTAKNEYNVIDQYSENHPNALSDGDEAGKGLNGDSIGSLTDKTERKKLAAKNVFNQNNQYKGPSSITTSLR